MTIATLQPIAERAAAASTGGRLVLLDISRMGITVAGKLFLPGRGATLAEMMDAPARTYSSMLLVSWSVIHIRGADAVDAALSAVIENLDRRAEAQRAG